MALAMALDIPVYNAEKKLHQHLNELLSYTMMEEVCYACFMSCRTVFEI